MLRLVEPGDPGGRRSLAEELDGEGIERPAERAYQGIRRAILRGELPAGSHLGEEALAKMTGTSRTPVREALRRLVGEGLARANQRHRFVADFSFEEVSIVFEIRARLESYAARIAAAAVTAEELEQLERIVDAIDEIGPGAGDAGLKRFVALNTRFHAAIIGATHSTQMQTLSAQALSLPLELIKQFVWEQRVNIARSNDQHRDIVAALRARNADWAEAAMSGHILSTRPAPKPQGGSGR
ncbi:GntR family transcriptional regulator [Jiella endophytica]|uniref:GntR family transcriptional regulator n=1 Tax=Jiella endophytica TaxID=2558362 RepID=A0A4Y8RTP9_9HYPH|nr:GntR family transcriptional regulator [Jiella endophytica]TFF27689.1 GntR family transcriptional regulator [Jiella endophytica]